MGGGVPTERTKSRTAKILPTTFMKEVDTAYTDAK
jgi:hypothetical protein